MVFVQVRFPQVGRDTILRHAEVISREGDILRVKVDGELRVREVQASDTMPMKQVYGPTGRRLELQPQKQFPGPHALGSRI